MELTIDSPVAMACTDCADRGTPEPDTWTDRERRVLLSLLLPGPDDSPPVTASNRFSSSEAAAELGRKMFFDRRLSGNGQVSCATCHQPDRYYTDGLPLSRGTGQVARNAPTIVGAAYQRWFYWDGRRDSLWAQALIPFEAASEMGGSRLAVIRAVSKDPEYRQLYESIFDELPAAALWESLPADAGPYGEEDIRNNWAGLSSEIRSRINLTYSNLGKSIAAFERTLRPPETRFDRYVRALDGAGDPPAQSRLSEDEVAGARLFMDSAKTQCLQCHNGHMLSNGDFHNIGTGSFTGPNLDFGRVFGLRAVLMDEFNCLGPYSDAEPAQCVDLRFLNRDAHIPLEGAFKVPTLRGLKHTAPYFHDGRFPTLREVLEYYNSPPDKRVSGPHELRPLGLTDKEISQLERFLLALSH
jgi:cytochrome c peroxidase